MTQSRPRPSVASKIGRGAVALLLAASLGTAGVGTAFATESESNGVPEPFWTAPSEEAVISGSLLKTYGVRAGSAGPDFLGITNTNFDFTGGSASSLVQYTGYAATLGGVEGAGLAIWATSVNENPNPYYQNLYYNAVFNESYTQATTWMSNPSTGSWGDSNNVMSYEGNVSSGAATIAGLEFRPDIIFGANKYVNWNLSSNGSNSETNMYTKISTMSDYGPTFANNDATNLWTQVYTMEQLARTAYAITSDTNSSKTTRYDDSDATVSALSYEMVTRGQLLYIASQIDSYDAESNQGVEKKTVAYLYAIDASGKAYFFTPTAENLLVGNDTGKGTSEGSASSADENYAANNSTINMGYMATLPFITNTFNSGTAFYDETNKKNGIVMCVEDIYKVNPACVVAADDYDALEDVDVIIANSTMLTSLAGTSGGRNSSGVDNDYAVNSNVLAASGYATVMEYWAGMHGFTGTFIYGDDFGTSTNQGYGSEEAISDDMAPLLYCQRNYTADKNARAAWAFAQVYPELYGNNANATYAYWVNKVYHVKTDYVPAVAAYMTNQSSSVTYTTATASDIEAKAAAGYSWWVSTGSDDSEWSAYAYYNGSSRASYYSGNTSAEEPLNTIGIFEPSYLWKESIENDDE